MFRIIASSLFLVAGFSIANAAFQPSELATGAPLTLADGASIACGTGLAIVREQGYQNVRILDCKTKDGFDYYTGVKTDPGKVTAFLYWIRVDRNDGTVAAIIAPGTSSAATATGRNS
jgi:hypothetical protein